MSTSIWVPDQKNFMKIIKNSCKKRHKLLTEIFLKKKKEKREYGKDRHQSISEEDELKLRQYR